MADDEESELLKGEKLVEDRHRDWSDLPSEILSLILSYSCPDNISQFGDVCKRWQSVLIPSIPDSIKFPVVQHQWLMCGNSSTRYKFFHPVCNESYHMEFPELFGARLRFSKDGWLLMSRGEHSIFFFNPFTRAMISLPDLPHRYKFGGISFLSLPTSSDCMVFGFSGSFDEYISVSTIHRGEEAWHCFKTENYSSFYLSPCNPVFNNGMFYCLGQYGNLGVFDPKDNGSWTVCALPPQLCDYLAKEKEKNGEKQPCKSPHQNFLIECDGELISVFVGFMGSWVSVFKLDNSQMAWREVDNLGNKTLFVSETTSLSATKIIRGMENKIYFPRIHGKHGVFYSMATRRFQTFGKNHSRKDFYDTRELLHCSWIGLKSVSHSEEELDWHANHTEIGRVG